MIKGPINDMRGGNIVHQKPLSSKVGSKNNLVTGAYFTLFCFLLTQWHLTQGWQMLVR